MGSQKGCDALVAIGVTPAGDQRWAPFQWGWRVSGDSDRGAPALSSAAPGRLHMHGPATSTFALVEVWAADEAP
jgi:hypothetical protein